MGTPAHHRASQDPIVLALYINARGIGVAVFDDVLLPSTYYITRITGDDAAQDIVARVRRILERHRPSVLVLQECRTTSGRFAERIVEAVRRSASLARRKRIAVHQYGRADVRSCFAYYGAANKHEIARVIAKQLPELARRVPQARKLWETEHYQMKLFEAFALAFTYYSTLAKQR